jgi:hypothetical protein
MVGRGPAMSTSGILRMSGSPLIVATVAGIRGIGAKKLFCNPIDLHRLLARSSTVEVLFWQFLKVSELF